MMDCPAPLLTAFPPSPNLLLDLARRRTDDAMLWEIARADYGWEADRAMKELRLIRDSGTIHAPISWPLAEVLGLSRYHDPDRPNPPPFEPGPSGRVGHQIRLFACAVLLRIQAEFEEERGGESLDPTLAACLISAGRLDDRVGEAVARFLTWRIAGGKPHQESWMMALGLLILATRLRGKRRAGVPLGAVAGWVFERESLDRRGRPGGRPRPFGIAQGMWRPLADELNGAARAAADAAVCADLDLCALLLDPG